MSADTLLSTLVTLFVTIDPVGLGPIFLAMTPGMAREERWRVATRATTIALAILTFFAIGGEVLLHWLGIGLPAFRIAGGLLLFWIAFEMVFGSRADRKRETAETALVDKPSQDHAIFPLATPLMAGPGAITAVMLLSSRAEGDLLGIFALLVIVCLVMAACFGVFIAAETLSHRLGESGGMLLSRLLGILLTALAVQFVVDGIHDLFLQ